MLLTKPRVLILAGMLSLSSLWSNSSFALGLGEIHLNSALNEPMNAEIDLIAAAPDELTALRASLASREAFTRYGIDKPPFLSTVTFKVGKAKDGRDVLLVRSTDAIPEPFVTFLVDVNWARGHLMREYTVLLDPPVYTPGENAGSSAPVTAPSIRYRRAINRVELILVYLFLVPARGPALASEYGRPGSGGRSGSALRWLQLIGSLHVQVAERAWARCELVSAPEEWV